MRRDFQACSSPCLCVVVSGRRLHYTLLQGYTQRRFSVDESALKAKNREGSGVHLGEEEGVGEKERPLPHAPCAAHVLFVFCAV